MTRHHRSRTAVGGSEGDGKLTSPRTALGSVADRGDEASLREESTVALASIDMSFWWYRARGDRIDEALDQLEMHRNGQRSVLDVGCGPGGSTLRLTSIGPVTAIDPSPAAARFLQERIPTARFILGGIADLDDLIADERFDLVSCFGALNQESVPDPAVALRGVADRVAPGGALLIDEPADARLRRQMDIEGRSARRFDLSYLVDEVQSAGFEIVTARYIHGWAWPVARVLAWRDRRRPLDPERPPSELTTDTLARTAYFLASVEAALARRGIAPRAGTGCWIVARRPTDP